MELKRLGDYVKIKTGKLDANASSENGKYPFFTCSVNNLWIDNYAYNCECVLIAGNGDLNVKYYEGKFNAYQRTYIVESINKAILDVRYLYYFMNKHIDVLRNNSIGGVIKYIKLGDLTEVIIPLPPIKTQKKIVEVLDKAQELIDAKMEQISLMDELIQSVFYEMYGDPVTNPKGWEVKKLDKVLEIDTKMIQDFENYKDYPHIGIDSIEKNTGKILNFRTVREDKPISGKYLFDARHIIYSKIRPNLNKVALPNFSGLCSADAYPLLVDNKSAVKEFIACVLKSDYFISEILKHSTRTNIPKVNKKQLLNFECIIPPVELQKLFAQKVDEIESQKILLKQSIGKLEDNYYSIMQKIFRGELFGGE